MFVLAALVLLLCGCDETASELVTPTDADAGIDDTQTADGNDVDGLRDSAADTSTPDAEGDDDLALDGDGENDVPPPMPTACELDGDGEACAPRSDCGFDSTAVCCGDSPDGCCLCPEGFEASSAVGCVPADQRRCAPPDGISAAWQRTVRTGDFGQMSDELSAYAVARPFDYSLGQPLVDGLPVMLAVWDPDPAAPDPPPERPLAVWYLGELGARSIDTGVISVRNPMAPAAAMGWEDDPLGSSGARLLVDIVPQSDLYGPHTIMVLDRDADVDGGVVLELGVTEPMPATWPWQAHVLADVLAGLPRPSDGTDWTWHPWGIVANQYQGAVWEHDIYVALTPGEGVPADAPGLVVARIRVTRDFQIHDAAVVATLDGPIEDVGHLSLSSWGNVVSGIMRRDGAVEVFVVDPTGDPTILTHAFDAPAGRPMVQDPTVHELESCGRMIILRGPGDTLVQYRVEDAGIRRAGALRSVRASTYAARAYHDGLLHLAWAFVPEGEDIFFPTADVSRATFVRGSWSLASPVEFVGGPVVDTDGTLGSVRLRWRDDEALDLVVDTRPLIAWPGPLYAFELAHRVACAP